MKFYRVGGCNRDEILGIRTKDVDFAVDMTEDFKGDLKALDMFEVMKAKLISDGFEEFVNTPDKFTWRAKVPAGHPLEAETRVADFVMCRKEGPYSDGRHPDFVVMGDLFDDLARRDFTVNAIAKDIDGNFIDPHGGLKDLEDRVLRFVGDAEQRIREDGLRVIRGMRFHVTKGLEFAPETIEAFQSDFAAECLGRPSISHETMRDELVKMFKVDTMLTLELFNTFPKLIPVIFSGNIRLDATMKKGA